MADYNLTADTTASSLGLVAGDRVGVALGHTLTIDTNIAALLITIGENADGSAVAAGSRYGHVVWSAGYTFTADGNTDLNISSGIVCSPAGADTSSKQSTLTLNGTSSSRCVLQNPSGTWDTSHIVGIEMNYGCVIGGGITLLNHSAVYGAVRLCPFDQRCNATELNIIDWLFDGSSSNSQYMRFECSVNIPISLSMTVKPAAGHAVYAINGNNWDVRVPIKVDIKLDNSNGGTAIYPWHGVGSYSTNDIYFDLMSSLSDIRPTRVIPTNLTVTGFGDEYLDVSWDNATSYSAKDLVYIYDNSDDSVLGVFFADTGVGKVCDLTNTTTYTIYAKASTNNSGFTDKSGTDSGTPAAGTPPTFAGATSIYNLFDGGLGVTWDAATGTCDRYEIHINTASISDADIAAKTYLVGAVDFGVNSYLMKYLKDGTAFVNGTLYYVRVKALNGTVVDTDTTELSKALVNSYEIVPGHGLISVKPVQLATTATEIYTCPAGIEVDIEFINVANTHTATVDLSLYLVLSGETPGDENIQQPQIPMVAANTLLAADTFNGCHLTPGDALYGLGSVADKLTATPVAKARTNV